MQSTPVHSCPLRQGSDAGRIAVLAGVSAETGHQDGSVEILRDFPDIVFPAQWWRGVSGVAHQACIPETCGMNPPIAWGELACFEHPDGLVLGREFELLPTGSMLGGVIGGVIGLPGVPNGAGSMAVRADGQPLIYGNGSCPLNALKPHQEAILAGFMGLAPWVARAEG